jgi:hypothetical protein
MPNHEDLIQIISNQKFHFREAENFLHNFHEPISRELEGNINGNNYGIINLFSAGASYFYSFFNQLKSEKKLIKTLMNHLV